MRGLIFYIIGLTLIFPRSASIAICTEVKGGVLRQGYVRNGHLRKGDPIYHGDKIIMEGHGFMSFMFISDKTKVNVYENSVIKVFSQTSSTQNQSNIALFGGRVIVQMEQGSDKQFVLEAPSSIAVASNAHFISEYKNDILFDNLSYSMFTSLEGKIEIENIVSESFMNIREGETVISTRDGKFLQLDTFRNQMFIENTLRGN